MDREYEDWLRNQTPESIRLANIARRRLRTLVSHSGKAKYAALKDDREVKRPLTSWVLYFVDRNASGDFRGIGAIQRAKDISAEYRSLSASELKVSYLLGDAPSKLHAYLFLSGVRRPRSKGHPEIQTGVLRSLWS